MAVLACTKPNPEVCCVTPDQCSTLGAAELRPCGVGQACSADFTCVAAECTTSADCEDPNQPVCSLGLCIDTCRVDADCAEVPGRPFCAGDGVCVGCVDAMDCGGDATICDAGSRSCRGCEADAECASDVCVEATGVCADETEVVFVSTSGNDSGTCPSTAPCRTLAYALTIANSTRNVIHVEGGTLSVPSTLTVSISVTFDGTGTLLTSPANGPIMQLATAGAIVVVVEGFRVSNASDRVDFNVGSKTLRMFDVTLQRSSIQGSGTFEAAHSEFRTNTITCSGGTLAIEGNEFSESVISGTNCQTTIRRNRFFDAANGTINTMGGLLLVENNLLVEPSEFVDAIIVSGHSSGSTIAFNTIVNTSQVTMSPAAVTCDATVRVTSNIFAYNSTNPINGIGCVAVSSLFDLPGAPDATGNTSAASSTFFIDAVNSDFHLATNSPALGIGEAGLVDVDLEGNPRPMMPDVGAFEAP